MIYKVVLVNIYIVIICTGGYIMAKINSIPSVKDMEGDLQVNIPINHDRGVKT